MGWREKIRISRERVGLSQKELGERIGVKAQAINLWENGPSYPSVKNLLLAAENCGFDLAWIFSERPDELPGDEERAARVAFEATLRALGPKEVFDRLVIGERLVLKYREVVELVGEEAMAPLLREARQKLPAENTVRELEGPRPATRRRRAAAPAAQPASKQDLEGEKERPKSK